MLSFHDLQLPAEILRALDELGFQTATDIQAQTIPLIRSGRDVIGRSQTGTGKTLAFGIPAVECIDPAMEEKGSAQVLILCPTRELAVQAGGELRKLSRFLPGVRCAEVYGGAPMDRQIARLRTANLVVGTPGRVMDHMRRHTLRLNRLQMIVLDEADEMLSMGFREDIETILSSTPEERRTILFSATMPSDILALTEQYQREPELVEIASRQETVENIRQTYCEVPMGRKMDALVRLVEAEQGRLTLIFCNTKRMVDDITAFLTQRGIPAEGLHGDMKQSQRDKVMESFRRGQVPVLAATDVAARGIDVSGVKLVINYDIPQNTEYYIHRIGRTGRAGKAGRAVTLCCGRRQVAWLRSIARTTRSEVSLQPIPTTRDIRRQKEEAVLASLEGLMQQEPSPYRHLTDELSRRGYTAEQIADAVLLLHLGQPAPEEDDLAFPPPRTAAGNRPAGPFRRLSLSIGRRHHIAPNHIVGAIAERTGLPGRHIGKIEIYDAKTLVDVPESEAGRVVEMMQGCVIAGHPVQTAFAQKPSAAHGPHPGRPTERSKKTSRSRRPPYTGQEEKRKRGIRQ